jgi:CRP-like cAMP-binding protein
MTLAAKPIEPGRLRAEIIFSRPVKAPPMPRWRVGYPGGFLRRGLYDRPATTVMAMTECVIMRLDKTAVVRVLHDEPKFSEMFMSYLLARNSRIEEDLVDQLFNSSEKRLARALLLLANFGKEGRPEPVANGDRAATG